MRDAGVDPAAVAATPTLDADLPADGKGTTDFHALPGVLTAHCVRDGRLTYLAIGASNDPAGAEAMATVERLADYSPAWGLHGLDLNLAEGTLVEVVRRQAAAYAKKAGAYR